MKITASILAMIAFVAIFMTVLTEARLGLGRRGRPKYPKKNKNKKMDINEFVDYGRTYRLNGYTMDSRRYLANPTRSAQIKARNAGALTNSEARSMGLRNYRDEIGNDDRVGWRPSRYRVAKDEIGNDDHVGWGAAAFKIGKKVVKNYMDEEDESVGWDDQPSHTRAHRPDGQSMSNYFNNWRL